MSIRFLSELTAAAEFAERAVETVSPAPVQPMADATFDLGLVGEEIRISVGPGFIPAGSPKKLIPGQTYH